MFLTAPVIRNNLSWGRGASMGILATVAMILVSFMQEQLACLPDHKNQISFR